MKKLFILASLAFTLNTTVGVAIANAQSDETAQQSQDSKKSKKAKKEKKSKKDKKKKDNGEAANADSAPATLILTKPELKDGGDSIAYIFGAYQSNGLSAYMQQQLKVDTAYVNDFAKGILDRISVDPNDKKLHAYNAGAQVGTQIENMAQGLSKDYYAATPEKSVDIKIIANAIVASLLGQCELTSDSAQKIFTETMNARHEANKEEMYGPNRDAGLKFLSENKKKEGVITLPSGLQYKIITEGTGDKPTEKDKVKVNYEGRLIDGTVFDSSYKRNKPSTFQCNKVIKGWTEALQKMPVGSKWEIYIPYELAYGDRETGALIKPYSTLIFEVELLDIEKASDDDTKKSSSTKSKKIQVPKKSVTKSSTK